jgi:tetratricopeptide (TPR) repeat protein
MGSIYINMGEMNLAKLQVQKGLSMLEDVDHRESYFAALRNLAKVQIRLKQFAKAQESLEESIKHSPPYRALHRLQTKIGFVELFLAAGDIVQANEYIQEAENAARKYGFLHQLSRLYNLIRRHGLVYQI